MNEVQVTFRNIAVSRGIEGLAREKAAKLQRFFPRLQSCHVVVESANHKGGRNATYHVRIDVTVPGAELVANHEPAGNVHDDAYLAVRDAFDIMRRQIQDYAQRLRGDVKTHVSEMPAPATFEPELSTEGTAY